MKKTVAIIVNRNKPTAAYRIRRFEEEAQKRTDVSILVLPVDRMQYAIDRNKAVLFLDGEPLTQQIDAVYRATITGSLGVHIENVMLDAGAIGIYKRPLHYRRFVRGKMAALAKFGENHIPIPKTFYLTKTSSIDLCLQFMNYSFPLILKPEDGPSSCGKGVMIVDSEESFRSVVEFNLEMNSKVIVQEFVSESRGVDYRLIVAGDSVLGAMKRDNTGNDFRSNVYQGGVASAVTVSEEVHTLAINAVHSRNFLFGGVDIMLTDNGPVVLEVNNPCNFEAFEPALGINVAGAIIDLLVAE